MTSYTLAPYTEVLEAGQYMVTLRTRAHDQEDCECHVRIISRNEVVQLKEVRLCKLMLAIHYIRCLVC